MRVREAIKDFASFCMQKFIKPLDQKIRKVFHQATHAFNDLFSHKRDKSKKSTVVDKTKSHSQNSKSKNTISLHGTSFVVETSQKGSTEEVKTPQTTASETDTSHPLVTENEPEFPSKETFDEPDLPQKIADEEITRTSDRSQPSDTPKIPIEIENPEESEFPSEEVSKEPSLPQKKSDEEKPEIPERPQTLSAEVPQPKETPDTSSSQLKKEAEVLPPANEIKEEKRKNPIIQKMQTIDPTCAVIGSLSYNDDYTFEDLLEYVKHLNDKADIIRSFVQKLKISSKDPSKYNQEGELYKILSEVPKLTELSVVGIPLAPLDIEAVNGLESLDILSLTALSSDVADFSSFSDLKASVISIGSENTSSRIPLAIFSEIAKSKKVYELKFNNVSELNEEAISELAKMKSLLSLTIENCPNFTGEGTEKLGLLKTLSVKNSPLSKKGLQEISNNKTIKSLSLSGVDIDKPLLEGKPLESLTFEDCRLTPEAISYLKSHKFFSVTLSRMKDLSEDDINGLKENLGYSLELD